MLTTDFISEALRDIGAIDSGELPAPDEARDGLSKLNGLLDSLNTDSAAIYQISQDVYNLANGVGSYTIGRGIGANFAADRPEKIQSANIISGQLSYPLDIVTAREWSDIVQIGLMQAIPRTLYCDMAYPNATLNLYGTPQGTLQLELFTWKQLQQVALDTDLQFPPGYREALLYNLEVRLAISFGKQLDPVIAALATQSLGNVRRMNLPDVRMVSDQISGENNWNILTGNYN